MSYCAKDEARRRQGLDSSSQGVARIMVPAQPGQGQGAREQSLSLLSTAFQDLSKELGTQMFQGERMAG